MKAQLKIQSHSRLSGILSKKDSGQAGVTSNVISLTVFLAIISILTAFILSGCATGGGGKTVSDPNALGLQAFNKGNYPEAVRYFKEALELYPNDNVVWSNIGSAYFRNGNADDALRHLNKSIEMAPSYEGAFYWRSLVYYWKENYNKAIVDAEKLIWSKEFRSEALRIRSWSYFRKGMYKQAIEDFSSHIELIKSHYYGLNGRGWSYYYLGNFNQAIDDFNKALAFIEDDKSALNDALRGKAFAYLGLGDAETAVHLIGKAKQAKDYNSSGDLSLVHYVSGDKRKAWEYRGGESYIGLVMDDYKSGAIAGAKVTGTAENSPASNSGITAGDIIVRFNGTIIQNSKDVLENLRPVRVGDTVGIILLREGLEKRIPVKAASAEHLVRSNPLIAPIMKQRSDATSGGEVSGNSDDIKPQDELY